eukprot:231788-Prorocentrum_minimum.AAC.1
MESRWTPRWPIYAACGRDMRLSEPERLSFQGSLRSHECQPHGAPRMAALKIRREIGEIAGSAAQRRAGLSTRV